MFSLFGKNSSFILFVLGRYLMISRETGGGVEEAGLLVDVHKHLVLLLQGLRPELDHSDVRQSDIQFI